MIHHPVVLLTLIIAYLIVMGWAFSSKGDETMAAKTPEPPYSRRAHLWEALQSNIITEAQYKRAIEILNKYPEKVS